MTVEYKAGLERSAKVRQFLIDLDALMREHNVEIEHEDGHGHFLITDGYRYADRATVLSALEERLT